MIEKSVRGGHRTLGVDGVDVSYPGAYGGEGARKTGFRVGTRYSARFCVVPHLNEKRSVISNRLASLLNFFLISLNSP